MSSSMLTKSQGNIRTLTATVILKGNTAELILPDLTAGTNQEEEIQSHIDCTKHQEGDGNIDRVLFHQVKTSVEIVQCASSDSLSLVFSIQALLNNQRKVRSGYRVMEEG